MALDTNQTFVTDGLYLFSVVKTVNIKIILALLNSDLLTFIYRLFTSEKGRVLPQVKPTVLKTLPVPEIECINEATCKNIINLVDEITDLERQLSKTKNNNDNDLIVKRVSYINNQIN